MYIMRRAGKFAKSDYECIRFVVSDRPHGNTRLPIDRFSEIWYLCNFRKSIQIIQVSLKYDKNSGYITWTQIYIYDHISLSS